MSGIKIKASNFISVWIVSCFSLFIFLAQVSYATDLDKLSAAEKQTFNHVKSELSKQSELKGNFKQIRNIALLSKPLISSGKFELSDQNGLKWFQLEPFKSTLIVTDDQIKQTIDGHPPTIINKKDQPIVFAFTHIFLSLFQGDIELVKSYFNIDFQGNNNKWQVILTPKSSPLNKAINQITVRGSQYVNYIEVAQPRGDQMKIEFSNITEIEN